MAEPTIQLGGGNWAGKTDNLLGYYKEGERFYKQDFTFSRSTTGTYTDKDGYIQEMPYNLLTYSNDFTQWTIQSGVTATHNTTETLSPDGTNNATKFVGNGTTGVLKSTSVTGVVARSIYLKSVSGTINVTFKDPIFTVTQKSLSVTTEWQRFDLIEDNTHSSTQGLWIDDIPSSGIYMWGGQINKGSSAKTYFPTTTRLNMPRVDYLNNSNGSLILEPQRSNLITNSNSNSLNFALDNVSMTYNSIISPDGETNGILFEQTGSANSNSAYNYGLTTTDGTYSYSLFIKAKDSTQFRFYSSNGASTLVQDFNPLEMTEGILSGNLNLKFEDYGNGWFRVSFTRTLSSAAFHRLQIYPDRNNTQKGVYIFGLQVESGGNYATSYIPTSGSSVTRNADACSISNVADRINSTEGVIEIKLQGLINGGDSRKISISDGTNDNRIFIKASSTSNYWELGIEGSNGGLINDNFTTSLDQTLISVIKLKWKSGDIGVKVNDVEIYTNSSTFTMQPLNKLQFQKSSGNGDVFLGKIYDLKIYNNIDNY